ncbi:MAG: hypothetical protein IJN46_08335 [Lachnospiraceae bacterium]|nr:hypothetical protein [Lachnospiraceae bacterium]
MEGIFIRTKSNFLFLCGSLFVGAYVFLIMADLGTANDLLSFLITGLLCDLVAIPSVLLNRGAYFHIEENTISARYHWSRRLNCTLNEVAFVFPQTNTLSILLKDGTRHVIMGIQNSWALSSAIRRQNVALETESPDVIRQQLTLTRSIRKKEICWLIFSTVLMFANIFIAVILINGKEMHDFSDLDWILFTVMALIELLTVISAFYLAYRAGKRLIGIEHLAHRLRSAIIASCPMPVRHIKYVYTDEFFSTRYIVCGFPDNDQVYYYVQMFSKDFDLLTIQISEVFDNMDELMIAESSVLIDITSFFPFV